MFKLAETIVAALNDNELGIDWTNSNEAAGYITGHEQTGKLLVTGVVSLGFTEVFWAQGTSLKMKVANSDPDSVAKILKWTSDWHATSLSLQKRRRARHK